MKVSVIGTGYVGLVTGVCLADLGHEVTCIDNDAAKVAQLKRGVPTIYETGLPELLTRNIEAGRLHFVEGIEEGVRDAQVIFIAVGTPPAEDGQPDLTQLKRAFSPLARSAPAGSVLVVKSTVPIGTSRWLAEQIKEFRAKDRIMVASNPEFLRQGSAVEDFLKPDRIVAGSDSAEALAILEELYAPLTEAGAPLLTTTFESSELIKYAANTMLAARVAFINEISDLCEKLGANVRDVSRGVGLDPRIGPQFLQAGPGFGGSCFPKDTLALKSIAEAQNVKTALLDAIVISNVTRKDKMLDKILRACDGSVQGKTLAILGLTFKPNTDDMRESISLSLLPQLAEMGANVRAYDPQGMGHAKEIFGTGVHFAEDAYDAATGANACIILTEWNEFKSLDLLKLKKLMINALIIDLRNIYKRRTMQEAGFRYISIGRSDVWPELKEVKDRVGN